MKPMYYYLLLTFNNTIHTYIYTLILYSVVVSSQISIWTRSQRSRPPRPSCSRTTSPSTTPTRVRSTNKTQRLWTTFRRQVTSTFKVHRPLQTKVLYFNTNLCPRRRARSTFTSSIQTRSKRARSFYSRRAALKTDFAACKTERRTSVSKRSRETTALIT